jgi:predicted DNA-binding transcriptional regulator AlpA
MTTNPFEILEDRLQRIEAHLQTLTENPPKVEVKPNKFLTADEVCEKLSITRVTLWSWDKKNITKPLRIGNLKRYKLSDIEAFGENVGNE